MPLRDHFHSPLDDFTSWESFHAGWPMVIVQRLRRKLPRRYVAAPRAHSGSLIEVDVATFEKDDAVPPLQDLDHGNGSVTSALWSPAQPTLAIASDLPELDDYEVRVYDSKHGRRLVAAIEIVSPANKDRPEHRGAFVAKCVTLLQQRVSVTIIDLVTTRNFNLYSELLDVIGRSDLSLDLDPASLYAVACRQTRKGDSWQLETWAHTLTLGQPLPTLPLWLADNLAVPLDLEESYEQTCVDLSIP